MVGRAAFVFARDFLAAIDLFLVPACSDRALSFEIAGLATIYRHILHACVRLCRRLHCDDSPIRQLQHFLRLDLIAQPEDAELLGPLVVDEILIRLLRTPIGNRVAQIGYPKSGVHRMANAINWIREHFAHPVTGDEEGVSQFERSGQISATTMPTVIVGTCATTPACGFMTLVGP